MEKAKRVTVANDLREVAAMLSGVKESRLLEEGISQKEKAFVKMPNIKPPRRQQNNESGTREYRRDYQKEYREDNGNGYIPKLKKKEEDEDETSRFS